MNAGRPALHDAILHDAERGCWLAFRQPREIVVARAIAEVEPALKRVRLAVERHGWCAAGFVAYEAAPAFDSALTVHAAGALPLLWFGLYERCDEAALPAGGDTAPQVSWSPSVTREAYADAIARVRRYIEQGDTYQVNYTLRLRSPFRADPWELFLGMTRAQEAGYGAFLSLDGWTICCASPELFFSTEGGRVVSKPMKGTAARALTCAADREQAEWLRHSAKNRAENVMIVDMVRNDLGRIAEPDSVQVPRLFDVERYPTVWQMTSTVECRSRAPLEELFRALFPPASITGAPKARTMAIIRELETCPRGLYTGTVGFMLPGGRTQLNVAIRTAVIDEARGIAEYGVGGGIVWDSTSADEYEECCAKARVLTWRRPEFALIETMRWTPAQGFFLLDRHLRRLAESADYFGFHLDMAAVRLRLEREAAGLAGAPARVRLLVQRDGAARVETGPLPAAALGPVRLALATTPVDAGDVFLYHKTTCRRVYEEARQEFPEADDVLLWNTRGEVTETTIANLVVELDGVLCTPPPSCGLLAGTLRGALLAEGRVCERVIRVDDLGRCTRLWLVNALRGQREARLVPPLNG